MPTGFAAELRACRRPIVAVAVWLVVLQAFLAGLATAQAAAMRGSAPFDAGTICHGARGGGAPPEPKLPDTSDSFKVCCTFCATAAPAAALPNAPAVAVAQARHASTRPLSPRFTVSIARAAVRAGLSQAPPSIA